MATDDGAGVEDIEETVASVERELAQAAMPSDAANNNTAHENILVAGKLADLAKILILGKILDDLATPEPSLQPGAALS